MLGVQKKTKGYEAASAPLNMHWRTSGYVGESCPFHMPVPPADLPVSTDSIMLSAPEYGVAFHRVLCGESGQNFAHC